MINFTTWEKKKSLTHLIGDMGFDAALGEILLYTEHFKTAHDSAKYFCRAIKPLISKGLSRKALSPPAASPWQTPWWKLMVEV